MFNFDDYEPSPNFSKCADLFKGFIFEFEGLSEHTRECYIKIVTDLGAHVTHNAKYKFMWEDHYNNIQHDRDDCYNIYFITHCIELKKILDFNVYKFCPEKETSYPEKETVNASSIQPSTSTSNGYSKRNGHKSDSSSVELTAPTPRKRAKKRILKTIISYSSLSSESEEDLELENRPVKRFSKTTLVRNVMRKKSNSPKNNKDEEPETSELDLNSSGSTVIEIEKCMKKVLGSSNKATEANGKTDSPVRIKVENLEDSDVNRSFSLTLDSDNEDNGEENELKTPMWWLGETNIPENQQCKISSCSFDPRPHRKHDKRRRTFSLYEQRIILKYLIQKEMIEISKSRRVWAQMNSDGYLTHRTPESLRNNYRKTILENIRTYGLPKRIVKAFLNID